MRETNSLNRSYAGQGLESKAVAASYSAIRQASEALCEPLEPEDCCIQSMPDVSPTSGTWRIRAGYLRLSYSSLDWQTTVRQTRYMSSCSTRITTRLANNTRDAGAGCYLGRLFQK